MSEHEESLRAALEDRLRFETLIADLSSHFVNLDADLIDGAIQDAQRRLVEALGVERSTLYQLLGAEGPMVFTHYWSRPGHPPPPLNVDLAKQAPWMLGRVMKGEVVCFSSVKELPPDAPDREIILRTNTKSSVVTPLLASGRVIGALAFGALHAERTWPPELVNRLSLVAQIFASALARKRAETELRKALEENARLRDQLIEENVYLQSEVKQRQGSSELIGQSPAIERVMQQVDQVAPTTATVLLLGETGTGKELIATAIHERSPRRARAMVRVNCAAIPAALVESELFGREKGAYTGATERQIGRFELADGSTIFLDEVGELSPEVQVKLLRVLQEKQIERLGSSRSIPVDVRVIAATNRDLERAVAERGFREDLYYRLNVFPLTIPPLRERPEDIPALVRAFVDELSQTMGKCIESIAREDLLALQRHPWPGNVRELRNVIERAVIVSPGPKLVVEPPRPRLVSNALSARLDDVEREHIRGVLEKTRWRIRGQGGAAELLGLKPSTLEGRMARLELRRPRV